MQFNTAGEGDPNGNMEPTVFLELKGRSTKNLQAWKKICAQNIGIFIFVQKPPTAPNLTSNQI